MQVGQSNIAIGTIKMALFLLQVARGCVYVYPGMRLFFNFPLHVQEVSGFCCCLFVVFGGWVEQLSFQGQSLTTSIQSNCLPDF